MAFTLSPETLTAQESSDADDEGKISKEVALLMSASETEKVHFKLSDSTRPRTGYFLSKKIFDETGNNFRYCDGGAALFTDLQKLASVNRQCQGTIGPFGNIANFSSPTSIDSLVLYGSLPDGENVPLGDVALGEFDSSLWVAQSRVNSNPNAVNLSVDADISSDLRQLAAGIRASASGTGNISLRMEALASSFNDGDAQFIQDGNGSLGLVLNESAFNSIFGQESQ